MNEALRSVLLVRASRLIHPERGASEWHEWMLERSFSCPTSSCVCVVEGTVGLLVEAEAFRDSHVGRQFTAVARG